MLIECKLSERESLSALVEPLPGRCIMELKVVRNDSRLTHIALAGKLDVAGEQAIGDQFRNLVESYQTSFLVDMSQVTYLASLGIRLLFAGAKSLAAQGNRMVVVSPQPMVEETLLNSGTAKVITIARDEAQALELISL
jgi:anti-sigma B factor antagonist